MGSQFYNYKTKRQTHPTTMPVYKVKVTFFNDVYKIECNTDEPVAAFRAQIAAESGIEPESQKLKFGRKIVMPGDLESFEGWAGTEDMAKGSTADWAYKVTILD